MKFLVLNGPNINMLGLREPTIYGKTTYFGLVNYVLEICAQNSIEAEFFQSNHEGALVDAIQSAYNRVDGIIINPAAYTHTSIAILDALNAVGLPAAEVHISDISKREDFRRTSFAGKACCLHFIGQGVEGYKNAVLGLKNYILQKREKDAREQKELLARKSATAKQQSNTQTEKKDDVKNKMQDRPQAKPPQQEAPEKTDTSQGFEMPTSTQENTPPQTSAPHNLETLLQEKQHIINLGEDFSGKIETPQIQQTLSEKEFEQEYTETPQIKQALSEEEFEQEYTETAQIKQALSEKEFEKEYIEARRADYINNKKT